VYCQLGDGLIWSQEVAGASPVTPTNLEETYSIEWVLMFDEHI